MRNSLSAVVNRLQEILEQVEEYKDTAEDAEYPNDERITKLDDELDAIQSAIDELEGIE